MAEWTERYPQRWRAELRGLREGGWAFRHSRKGGISSLVVDYPLLERRADGDGAATPDNTDANPGPVVARLRVLFPDAYPFFPPVVYDETNALLLQRHRDPLNGHLCLIEFADWHLDMTLADLLTRQVPRLIEASRTPVEEIDDGLEVHAAEPHIAYRPDAYTWGAAFLAPDHPIPAGMDPGALVVRFAVSHGDLGAGLVERVLGPGLDIAGSSPRLATQFTHVVYGRWLRDHDFDLREEPQAIWQRLAPRLQPLAVNKSAVSESGIANLDVLGLLVPAERAYRRPGEEWVFLLRFRLDGGDIYHLVAAQYLEPELLAARSPATARLRERHVLLVGVGAIGGHLAVDLARTGIGRLDLVDRDIVDVATACRQYAPAFAVGRFKARALAAHLATNTPLTEVRALALNIGGTKTTPHTPVQQSLVAGFYRAVATADLVVDATANPAVTRYLAALRLTHGRPFLHVSATAGAWGGVVALLTADTGCWACLEHARADRSVPFPPPTWPGTSARRDARRSPSPAPTPTFSPWPHTVPASWCSTSPADPSSAATCTSPTFETTMASQSPSAGEPRHCPCTRTARSMRPDPHGRSTQGDRPPRFARGVCHVQIRWATPVRLAVKRRLCPDSRLPTGGASSERLTAPPDAASRLRPPRRQPPRQFAACAKGTRS